VAAVEGRRAVHYASLQKSHRAGMTFHIPATNNNYNITGSKKMSHQCYPLVNKVDDIGRGQVCAWPSMFSKNDPCHGGSGSHCTRFLGPTRINTSMAHACNKQADTDHITYVTGGRIICYTLQCSLIDISIPHKSAFYRVTGKNTVAPFSIQQQYSFLRMHCAHQVTLLT